MCITFLARRDCRFSNPRNGWQVFNSIGVPPRESAPDCAKTGSAVRSVAFSRASPDRRYGVKLRTKHHIAFAFMASQQVDVELSCVNLQSDVTYNLRQRKPVL
ncbi:hypothetical protein ASD8599_03004 [Ascidiaceihabitans donghaensis]|uniref:Uncharacterized protein n=1 Tax=Ascidiaceihabitans donghaensis TaxID=1510460 RepID=A0A2R8BGZ8_9RHOB|nr:hypothetical protein ASD8599_03004 [Ascidiaceihabitans donghaensis]